VRPYIPILLIFSLGTFLRFHALDRQSLWDDEMSTIHTISTPKPQLIQRFETYETHPPLYFLQLKLWRVMGFRSLVKLRANSALWGSLSLFLIYLLGRRYGGENLGLLAAGFLALSPYHLAYSQEMRPYAMAIALALAGWLNLERIVGAGHRPRPQSGFHIMPWTLISGRHGGLPLQVLLWTALLYTHYWGAFIVLAQVVYGIYASRSALHRKAILASAAAAGLIFSFWLPILFDQLGVIDRLAFWVSPFSVANLAKVFLAYTGLVFNMASGVFYLPARVWLIGLIGFSFAAALGMGLWRGPRAGLSWLLIGLGVPWLISYWKPTVFLWYRYPIHMLPAFVILVAAGLFAIKPRFLGVALVLVCLGSQAWGDWIYFHGWQKANPKAVVSYVHRLRQTNSLVVRPDYFGDLFQFYDQGTTPVIDEHVLDSPGKRAALHGRDVIFVAFDVPSDPIGDALLSEFKPASARYFPGAAHLGITVYELK
jgi:hypothetical protein